MYYLTLALLTALLPFSTGQPYTQVSLLILSHYQWIRIYNNQTIRYISGQAPGGIIAIIIIALLPWTFWENDYHRYILDGLHLINNIEPYHLSPEESPLIKSMPGIVENVGFPEIPTVYPPLTIFLFSLILKISLWSKEYFLQISKLTYMIIFFFCLRALIQKQGKEKKLNITYLLSHPLIISEVCINAHFDLIISATVALMLLSPSFFFLTVPVAFSIKYTVVLAVSPFFENKKNLSIKNILYLIIGTLISLSPFLFSNFNLDHLIKNITFFATEWEMNSGAFRFFRWITNELSNNYQVSIAIAGKVSILLMVLFMILIISKRKLFSPAKGFFLLISVLILLSPVCNPWYFLWGLPASFIIQGRSGYWARIFYLGTPLYYLNFPEGSHILTTHLLLINSQHIWYWLTILMTYKTSEDRNL